MRPRRARADGGARCRRAARHAALALGASGGAAARRRRRRPVALVGKPSGRQPRHPPLPPRRPPQGSLCPARVGRLEHVYVWHPGAAADRVDPKDRDAGGREHRVGGGPRQRRRPPHLLGREATPAPVPHARRQVQPQRRQSLPMGKAQQQGPAVAAAAAVSAAAAAGRGGRRDGGGGGAEADTQQAEGGAARVPRRAQRGQRWAARLAARAQRGREGPSGHALRRATP
mmetsp:Transcript_7141/g.22842  ORF Transcript_7141/g.22842 Transcript_7141/m.22842 type:complete len:229 (-) Transcript_7141:1424-2110(-)